MKKLNIETKQTIQLMLGIFLALVGVVLIFIGLFLEPMGEIHNSVLIAFGEVSTFSGALIGIDYKYRFERWKHVRKEEEDDEL